MNKQYTNEQYKEAVRFITVDCYKVRKTTDMKHMLKNHMGMSKEAFKELYQDILLNEQDFS